MSDPDPYSHDLLGKKLVLMRKQLRSVVRFSCQNADVEKQGEGRQQQTCAKGEIGIVCMTKIGRKSGMPLVVVWSYVLEAAKRLQHK